MDLFFTSYERISYIKRVIIRTDSDLLFNNNHQEGLTMKLLLAAALTASSLNEPDAAAGEAAPASPGAGVEQPA